MPAKRKPESALLTYDARAKIPKAIHDAIEERAAALMKSPSEIVREALVAYLSPIPNSPSAAHSTSGSLSPEDQKRIEELAQEGIDESSQAADHGE